MLDLLTLTGWGYELLADFYRIKESPDLEKAANCYKKAIEYFNRAGKIGLDGEDLFQLGLIHEKLASALSFLDQSESAGTLKKIRNQKKKAVRLLEQVLTLPEEKSLTVQEEAKEHLISLLYSMAFDYFQDNKNKEAERYGEKLLTLLEKGLNSHPDKETEKIYTAGLALTAGLLSAILKTSKETRKQARSKELADQGDRYMERLDGKEDLIDFFIWCNVTSREEVEQMRQEIEEMKEAQKALMENFGEKPGSFALSESEKTALIENDEALLKALSSHLNGLTYETARKDAEMVIELMEERVQNPALLPTLQAWITLALQLGQACFEAGYTTLAFDVLQQAAKCERSFIELFPAQKVEVENDLAAILIALAALVLYEPQTFEKETGLIDEAYDLVLDLKKRGQLENQGHYQSALMLKSEWLRQQGRYKEARKLSQNMR